MSGASASIQTRLVRGSDIGVGRRVRILGSGLEGTATVIGVDSAAFARLVRLDSNGYAIWLSPSDLEPLGQEEK